MTHLIPASDAPPASSYVTLPTIPLPDGATVLTGEHVWREALRIAESRTQGTPLVAVDVYPGADLEAVISMVTAALPGAEVIDVEDQAAASPEHITALIGRNLTDDRVFGVMSHFGVDEFYDSVKVEQLQERIANREAPTVLVGWGADIIARREADALVLVDMARWEIQQRQRAGAPNWRAGNGGEDNLRKYKRGFFVEWRTADRHKRTLFDRVDLLSDGNAAPERAGAVAGSDFRAALRNATTRPFRVVPFFDPGVWGGQWMKQTLALDPAADNFAWCFDCVPEENSLLLEADGQVVEIPAMDLVLMQPKELLGERTFSRFGAEFPIRFDFLDTMGGGNLSLQVHPLTDYIRETFGMAYTQDESYYMLDATEDAVVYLGVKHGVDREAMIADLRAASGGAQPFDAEKYVNTYPARKHDHFPIPAGTIHCSGADSMVLEISATPFIFTFKLWDWDRVGLDGIPRPVHLDHGAKNIAWERDSDWVEQNLLGQVEKLAAGDGWSEERTGLHDLEFIEVRRHWFTGVTPHDTRGTVNVLNLVEGEEAIVESPTGAFEPFVVHYAETFIVPAAVGEYTIRPHGPGVGKPHGTVKAYVRGTQVSE